MLSDHGGNYGHDDPRGSSLAKPYVVTLDIESLINLGERLVENIIAPVRAETLADLGTLTSQPLDVLGYMSLKREMEKGVDDLLRDFPSATVVSLDDALYKTTQAKAVLSLSRFCGLGSSGYEGSTVLGQTARPGALSVEEQLRNLSDFHELVITDVGCFEGAQMEFAVELLKNYGHVIVGIVVGILTAAASHRLEGVNGFGTRDVPVIGGHYYDKITDWIEERDFYPCLGGIVVADKTGVPIAAPNGINLPCRRPYLDPFASIRERASLYRPDAELIQFSRRQIERTIRLFRVLGSNLASGETAVTFEDLKWLLKKPSFPYSGIRELDELAKPRMPVVEFLRRVLEFVT